MTSRDYLAAPDQPVRITIPAEHVPVLRIDLLDRIASEADGVEGQAGIERRGYGYDPDLIIEALEEMQRLVGLLEDLGLDRPGWDPCEDVPPDQAVTGTVDADVLSRDYTEQLDSVEACLRESADVNGPGGVDDLLELRVAMRHVLAQIPGEAVAA